MLFNSISFLIFFPTVFLLYWFVANKNLKIQNLLLLVSSYFFYACWNWHFLFLLVFSTGLDYYTGLKISEVENKNIRKLWFWVSIIVNLGFLGIFKYYNFFATSFAEIMAQLSFKVNPYTLKVILPVGISFYTFHGLSYVIDIYKKRIQPEKNFIDYSLFVSFFPLLVAGPIERATHLLPQIKKKRTFNYHQAVDGLRQILWGFFKKIAIADQCATYANSVFNNSHAYNGSDHVIAAIFFAFQIYCDFSGYSDIALGVARLFGIELLRNFSYPYFSRDIAEFWRRWHISLSTWFRDYLYIPLGGSRGGTWLKIRNVFIIFIVSGFWHGANWTFIIWGALNALFILPSVLMKTNRNNLEIVAKGRIFPSFKEFLAILITFCITVFAWIFFRSDSIFRAISYVSEIFSRSLFAKPIINPQKMTLLIILFIIIEWMGREKSFAIANLGLKWPKVLRWALYYVMIFIILCTVGPEQQFIYFQF
jgi:alginate O-acetyltransferase complex protein AlgI